MSDSVKVLIFNLFFQDVKASNTTATSSIYLAERRLRQLLFRNGEYDARERPVLLSNRPVDVNVSLAIYAISSLVCAHQVKAKRGRKFPV